MHPADDVRQIEKAAGEPRLHIARTPLRCSSSERPRSCRHVGGELEQCPRTSRNDVEELGSFHAEKRNVSGGDRVIRLWASIEQSDVSDEVAIQRETDKGLVSRRVGDHELHRAFGDEVDPLAVLSAHDENRSGIQMLSDRACSKGPLGGRREQRKNPGTSEIAHATPLS